jgi:hypothetical protein
MIDVALTYNFHYHGSSVDTCTLNIPQWDQKENI